MKVCKPDKHLAHLAAVRPGRAWTGFQARQCLFSARPPKRPCRSRSRPAWGVLVARKTDSCPKPGPPSCPIRPPPRLPPCPLPRVQAAVLFTAWARTTLPTCALVPKASTWPTAPGAILGIEHGHEAATAHQEAVDAVRAVARRREESAWRLIGLTIRSLSGAPRPSLESFMEQHGLDGSSQSEALCAEAFAAHRKTVRGQRLQKRQLALLRRLERLAA